MNNKYSNGGQGSTAPFFNDGSNEDVGHGRNPTSASIPSNHQNDEPLPRCDIPRPQGSAIDTPTLPKRVDEPTLMMTQQLQSFKN